MFTRIKKLFKNKQGREFIWAVLDSVFDKRPDNNETKELLEKFLSLLGFQFNIQVQDEESSTLLRANIVIPKWPR